MITCPTTGRAIRTGIGFGDLASFDSATLKGNCVGPCEACGDLHLVDDSSVKVPPSSDLGLG